MDWAALFEFIGKAATAIAAIVASWWAYEKWRKRDEHFPRIVFEVSANFIGVQQERIIVEIVAVIENKGVVPLKYKTFGFKLRGLQASDRLLHGDGSVRGQLLFPHLIAEGSFIPEHWSYSFVYPGVKTEYNFVTDIPVDIAFVRVQADMNYMLRGESHHAAKILRVPSVSVCADRISHGTVATIALPNNSGAAD